MNPPIKPHPPAPDKPLVIRPIIRLAEPADAPAIAHLAKALASHENEATDFTATTFLRDFTGPHPAAQLWVATHDDTPIGFLMAYMGYDLSTATRGLHLGDLFVLPTHRRQGIAKQLFDTALTWAHSRNGHWVSWTALTTNPDALAFYKSLGATHRDDIAFMALSIR